MIVSIRDSVISELREQFPEHKIYDEKVLQGLKKPCFFVDLIPVAIEDVTPNLKEYSLFIDVQYMSKGETKHENLIMTENFTKMFNTISFDNLSVNTTDKRFEIVDGILHCIFDLDFKVIGTNTTDAENIGELIHNKTLNEGGF